MARTYLPKFLQDLLTICEYTTKYDQVIRRALPETAIPAYDQFKEACSALLAVFPDVLEPV